MYPQEPTPQAPVDEAALLEEGQRRLTAWVEMTEQNITNNAPAETVAQSMIEQLPPEALEGFVQYPVEAVLAEVSSYVQHSGVLTSPEGIDYLKRVQALMRAQPVNG